MDLADKDRPRRRRAAGTRPTGFPIRLSAWILVALLGAALPAAAATKDQGKPLFELGVVGGVGSLPDYPAAGENHFQWLALPLVIYRGRFLRAGDRGLVRGRLLRNRRYELDVSLSGSFPVDSDHNDARRGMPNLDWLGEIGPRLQITMARAARDAKIDLELPLRAAFSTDFTSDFNFRGFVFAPSLAYQHENFLGTGVELKLSGGATFATNALMDYFYEVQPRFATARRPAFAADGGYLGANVELLLAKRWGDRIRFFLALRGDYHGGATNHHSPLFLDRTTGSVGIGMAVTLYRSERRVAD